MTKKIAKLSLQSTLLVAFIIAAFYLARIAQENEPVRMLVADYGYVGIFVTSVVSGFNLVVPIPAIAFLPLFLESGLSFALIILFISAGVTLADTVAYFIGRAGRHIMSHSVEERVLVNLERVRARYHWAPITVLFLFAAFAPLPNEIVMVPLGLLGYRLLTVLPVAVAGNLVFNALYATGTIGLFNLL